MDNNTCIERVVQLYFAGHSVEEALKLTKSQRKQEQLKDIVAAWENKAEKAPVCNARGWKYQQPKLI